MSRDALRRTLASVAELPERQRAALLAVAVEGRPHGEVARELGMTDGALRQLVHRARSAVRSAVTAVTPAPLMEWLAQQGARGAGVAGVAKAVAIVAATGSVVAGGAVHVVGHHAGPVVAAAAAATPRSIVDSAPPRTHRARGSGAFRARPSPRRSSPSPAPARGPARRPHRARAPTGQAPPRRAPPPGGARDSHAQRLDGTGPDAARRAKRPPGATHALPRARPARDHTHGHGVDAPAPTARRVPRGRLPSGDNAHRAATGDDADRAAAGDRTAALGPPAHLALPQGSVPHATPRYEGVCPFFSGVQPEGQTRVALCNRGTGPLVAREGSCVTFSGVGCHRVVTKAIRP